MIRKELRGYRLVRVLRIWGVGWVQGVGNAGQGC